MGFIISGQATGPVTTTVPGDSNAPNTTLLLSGDGTNNAANNTFVDSSSNNFAVTRVGNTTQGTFSPYGPNWSNFFDGSSYLNVASATASGSGSFCLEAWIYLTNITAQQQIIANATSGGMFLGINVNAANKLGIGRTFVAIDNEVSVTWVANTWYHIAVNRSGSSLQFFVNGTQVGTTGSNSINYSTSGRQIGSESSGTSNFYGYISNLRCVNASVYTTTFTPSTTPLTAITSTTLLTCQSNRFIDNSSNNFTITATGSLRVQRFSPFSPTAAYSAGTIGGSGYFDGTGDQLNLTMTGGLGSGNFTLEYWFYPTSLYDYITPFGLARSSTGFNVGTDSAGLLVWYSSSARQIAGGSIKPNQWHHAAFVRSGSTLTGYLNGVSVGTATVTTDFSNSAATIGSLGGSEFITGYLSNLRVVVGTAVYTSAFTPPTAPVTAISGTSLLLNYTNGGIVDSAMMNDLETVGNAKISTAQTKFGGGSMLFDGSGDYLLGQTTQQTLTFGTGNFTVECWAYPVSYMSPVGGIVDSGSGVNGNRFSLVLYANGKIYVDNNTNLLISNTTISTSTWTHIAICRSNGTMTMYFNGTSVGSVASSTNFSEIYNRIGSTVDGYSFNGYIDDLRITKGYARYTSNFSAPTAALSAAGTVTSTTTGAISSGIAMSGTGTGMVISSYVAPSSKAIFGYGYTSYSITNLVSNTGVVGNNVTGVGTGRYSLAAASYGTDKAIFGYGAGIGYQSMTNLVSNTGVVGNDVTGVGTVRDGLAAAGYGSDKAIFGYGQNNSSKLSMTNLVSNTGVVAADTSGVGTPRNGVAAAGYGTDKAIFGYGLHTNASSLSMTNLVSNTGVVGNDVTGVGTARHELAATGYGSSGQVIFGYGRGTGNGPSGSMTNLVSNTGVVATNTTGVGTTRAGLGAARFGTDKAIFGYGSPDIQNDVNLPNIVTNIVSNTGVVASDTTTVGNNRWRLAAASYSS